MGIIKQTNRGASVVVLQQKQWARIAAESYSFNLKNENTRFPQIFLHCWQLDATLSHPPRLFDGAEEPLLRMRDLESVTGHYIHFPRLTWASADKTEQLVVVSLH